MKNNNSKRQRMRAAYSDFPFGRKVITATEIVPLARKLYPNGSEEELIEVTQNLSDYVAVVLRIFDRLELEKKQEEKLEGLEPNQPEET
jgi:hypothetical protein